MKTLVGFSTGNCSYHMSEIVVVILAICIQCEEEEETTLYFINIYPASSALMPRYPVKAFFKEESMHSLLLEDVFRFVGYWEGDSAMALTKDLSARSCAPTVLD